MNQGHFLSLMLLSVFESGMNNPFTRLSGDGRCTLGMLSLLNPGLIAGVEPLGILSEGDHIHIPEGRIDIGEGLGGPDVGIEFKLLPETDIDRSESGSDRGREWAFECNFMLSDRLQGLLRDDVARLFIGALASQALYPVDLRTGNFKYPCDGPCDFGAHPGSFDKYVGCHDRKGVV